MAAPIPPVAHFVWFGRSFPWLNWLAVRSAADRGGYERVLLHHEDDLSDAPHFRALAQDPRIECLRLDFHGLLESVAPVAPGIVEVGASLTDASQNNMKSDLARFALLWLHGGVYLDVDTVSIAALDDVRAAGGFFCGAHRLVWPWDVVRSRNPIRLGLAAVRSLGRDLLRRSPQGWRHFRRIEWLYPTEPNTGVLGSVPQHPVLLELLTRAARVSPQQLARSRGAVATDLLEEVVSGYQGDDLKVYPPEVFYPLGPEISEHWFRVHSPDKAPRLAEVLGPNTRVVHWYASVRAKQIVPVFDASYVKANRTRQLLSALSEAWVTGGESNGAYPEDSSAEPLPAARDAING